MTLPMRRQARGRCSTNSPSRPMMQCSRSSSTAIWRRRCRPTRSSGCTTYGVVPRTTPTCGTVRSGSARAHSATCLWHFLRTADVRAIADRTTTMRSLPPRHALLAFGLWLRHVAKADALVHMGAHGTLEWLPGKAVALTGSCFPELVVGSLPVIYPFIVSNPGEAAQAKRRIAAVTIGHLPPPLDRRRPVRRHARARAVG